MVVNMKKVKFETKQLGTVFTDEYYHKAKSGPKVIETSILLSKIPSPFTACLCAVIIYYYLFQKGFGSS